MAWNKIFAANVGSSSSCGPSPLGRRTGTSFPSPVAHSELSSYLDSNCVVQYNEEFNILIWWHEHKRMLTVKIRQPSHEFTFGVGISFIPYPLLLTPVV
jgi:hypothetical protein